MTNHVLHFTDPDDIDKADAPELYQMINDNPQLVAKDSIFVAPSGNRYRVTRIEIRPQGAE